MVGKNVKIWHTFLFPPLYSEALDYKLEQPAVFGNLKVYFFQRTLVNKRTEKLMLSSHKVDISINNEQVYVIPIFILLFKVLL